MVLTRCQSFSLTYNLQTFKKAPLGSTFQNQFFILLAAVGLGCSTQAAHCGVPALYLLVQVLSNCGTQLAHRDHLHPCIGK